MNKVILIAVLLSAVFAVVLSTGVDPREILSKFENAPKKEMFKVYHFLYKKNYDLNSEEGVKRYRIFKQNMQKINEENAKNHPYKLGVGPFTDLTNEEYRQKVLVNADYFKAQMKTNLGKASKYVHSGEKYTPGTVKIDHSAHFGPVKDQGACGSCWAFCTVGVVEAMYKKQYGQSFNLSTQQLVDCDTMDNGCQGGWPTNAFNYMKSNGIMKEENYAYTSGKTQTAGSCVFKKESALDIVSGQSECPWGACDIDSWIGLLKQGPATVVVDAGSFEVQNYRYGIINPPTCGDPNHGVIAIAFQNDPTLGDYITVRNSWSNLWGDNGNFKISYNPTHATCQVTQMAWIATVKQNPNPTPPPAPTTCPKVYTSCDRIYGTEMCKSLSDLSVLKLSDSIQALDMGVASNVSLYDQTDCRGNRASFSTSNICMNNDLNVVIKRMSSRSQSISVLNSTALPKTGCIALFSDCCFSGERVEICSNISDLTSYNMNDKVSSILFGSGVKNVTAYIDSLYQGLAFGFNESTACIKQGASTIFNDEISSIRINLS